MKLFDLGIFVGRTVESAQLKSLSSDQDEVWEVTCSDGSSFEVCSVGGPYCSSSLVVKELRRRRSDERN